MGLHRATVVHFTPNSVAKGASFSTNCLTFQTIWNHELSEVTTEKSSDFSLSSVEKTESSKKENMTLFPCLWPEKYETNETRNTTFLSPSTLIVRVDNYIQIIKHTNNLFH